MNAESFERDAARFQRLSVSSPRAYRALVVALGALGFAVVGLVVLAMAAVLAIVVVAAIAGKAIVLVKLGIPLGLTFAALLKATWVKLERPTGRRLDRREAPALFAEIARIRRLGRVPRIHSVIVDASLNAGVSQTPRLGLLGWPHNDLVLGLPLLLSLSPASFQAVLAHELGHLSGRHGRTGAWIFRVRITWMRMLAALELRKSGLGKVLGRFFGWYGPFFGAASLALARDQERQADRFSAAATDPATAAGALAAVQVADWALERRFWPAMMRRTAAEPAPPAGYLEALEAEVRSALRDPAAGAALERSLLRRSRGGDTHPALAERIAALGQEPRLPPPSGECAASHYLGDALPRIRAELDSGWTESVRASWAQAHEKNAALAKRLAELEAAASAGPLGPDEAWARASITEDLRGVELALPLARDAAQRHPEHAPARYGLGRLLLAHDDDGGVAHVERAMELDPDAELPGAQLLASHYLSQGRNDRAARFIARAEVLAELHGRAAAERQGMAATDPIDPHGLSPEDVAALVATLRSHPKVKKVFLARKRLRHFPDRAPVFVAGVVARRPWHRIVSSDFEARLAQELANGLPGDWPTFVFVRGARSRALFRRARRLAGARVV